MKKSKEKYGKDIINILSELHSNFPEHNIGKHISTALDEFSDVWGVSDKELLKAFKAYKIQLEMDVPRGGNDEEIERIIYEGTHLPTILEDNEEEL